MATRPPIAATRPATTMASPLGCWTAVAGLVKTFGCSGAIRLVTSAGCFSSTPYSEPLATCVTGRSVDERSTVSVVVAWATGTSEQKAQPRESRASEARQQEEGGISPLLSAGGAKV